MKNFRLLAVAILAIISFSYSCQSDLGMAKGGSGELLNIIPQNAISVTEIDIPSIMKKMEFEEVKEMEFYEEMVADARRENPVYAEVLLNPESSGIDLNQNQYIANILDEKNAVNSIMLYSVSLSDESAFAKLLDNAGLGKPKNIEAYNYIKIDRRSAIAWNEKIAIMLNSSGYGSSLEKGFRQIVQTDAGNSINNDKNLKKCFRKNHDINSWVSTNPIAANKNFAFYASMLNMEKEDLENNYIHSHMDFERGAITGESSYDFTQKLEEQFGMFVKDGVNTKFDKLLPADNLIYATSLALNAEGIKSFINKSGSKAFINFALMEYGISIDEITDLLDGDLAISAYVGEGRRDADGLVLIKINDTDQLEKVLELAEDNELISKISNDRYSIGFQRFSAPSFNTPFGGSRIKTEGEMLIKDDMVYISSSPDLIEQINTGDYTAASKKGWAKDLLRNSSFSTFIDFKNIEPLQEELQGRGIDHLQIVAKDGRSNMRLQMDNKARNSLKSLMEMMNEIYLKDKRRNS